MVVDFNISPEITELITNNRLDVDILDAMGKR